MTKTFKITIVAFLLLLLLGAIFLFRKNPPLQISNIPSPNIPILSNQQGAPKQNTDSTQPTEYASPDGYYFYYPQNFTIGQFDQGEGSVVLVQSPDDSHLGIGFQIYSQPFDEPGPLTADRIKKDLPSVDLTHGQKGSLDGEQAIIFTDSTGLYNVWLLHNKVLFEISSTTTGKESLMSVLNSWKWSE